MYYTGGSGTISFRLFAYDDQAPDGPLEFVYATGTSSTFFNFNSDTQVDHFENIYFGETNLPGGSRQLGFKPSGTFTADSMTAFVLCHRVV